MRLSYLVMTFFVSHSTFAQLATGSTDSVLRLESTIPLPAVTGRIDHMDIDVGTHQVFLAAIANSTVEVIDLKEEKWKCSLTSFDEPQGVLCLPQMGRLYVTNGGNGTCSILDLASLKIVKTIPGMGDADNIRYDPLGHRVYVGYGDGGLAVIDPTTEKVVSRISFKGHPESFQLEKNGGMIYVNVPGRRKILVFEAGTGKAVADWEVVAAERNFPMALDESHRTLFIGCRAPGRLLVMDARSGGVKEEIPIDSDIDDIFYDDHRSTLYLSCCEGTLLVLGRDRTEHYRIIERLQTRKGARTSLFVPSLDILLVAAPATTTASAGLLVYSAHRP